MGIWREAASAAAASAASASAAAAAAAAAARVVAGRVSRHATEGRHAAVIFRVSCVRYCYIAIQLS